MASIFKRAYRVPQYGNFIKDVDMYKAILVLRMDAWNERSKCG